MELWRYGVMELRSYTGMAIGIEDLFRDVFNPFDQSHMHVGQNATFPGIAVHEQDFKKYEFRPKMPLQIRTQRTQRTQRPFSFGLCCTG